MKNTYTLHGFLWRDRGRLLSYTVLGAGALSLGLFAFLHGLHPRMVETPVLAEAPKPAPAVNPYGPMVVGLGPWARTASAEATPQQTAALETAAQTPVTGATGEVAPADAEAVPLPPRKPAELKNLASRAPEAAPMRQAALPAPQGPAAAPADTPSFFEKIFGGAGAEQQQAAPAQSQTVMRNGRRQQVAAAQPEAQPLAYASQETTGGLFGGLTRPAAPSAPAQPVAVGPAPRAGAGTAVYDISAHTVYMPDGTRLEAHSGLREHLDDPRFVHVRMKGPTPPSVYALTPREALFHGVEALRLTPLSGNIYGRAGLLAHTYMLGPNGDSNGCVSFRNYDAFLQAYKRGEVRRLVVVSRM